MDSTISRRALLGGFVAGAASTIVPNGISRFLYDPQTIPDYGTKLDYTKATKALKLANYVIRQDNDHRIRYKPIWGKRRDYRTAIAEIIIDDLVYTIQAILYEKEIVTKPDVLSISIRHKGKSSISIAKAHFKDIGLDGRCNEGWLSKDLIQLNRTRKDVEFGIVTEIGSPKRIWVQDRNAIQKAYDVTLDRLIQFYELPKFGYM